MTTLVDSHALVPTIIGDAGWSRYEQLADIVVALLYIYDKYLTGL